MKTPHITKQYKTFKEIKAAYLKTENPGLKKIIYCKQCEAYHLLDKN